MSKPNPKQSIKTSTEQLECPFCLHLVRAGTKKCPHCHEFLSAESLVDPKVFEVVKHLVIGEAKMELHQWIRQLMVGSVIVALIIFALQVVNFKTMLENAVETRVEERIAPDLADAKSQLVTLEAQSTYLRTLLEDTQKTIADNVPKQIAQVQNLANQVKDLDARYRQVVSEAEVRKAIDIARLVEGIEVQAKQLQADVSERVKNYPTFEQVALLLGSMQLTMTNQQIAIDHIKVMTQPRVSLVSPVSLSAEYPLTLYSKAARLEWRFKEYDMRSNSFEVQFANTPEFAPSITSSVRTKLAAHTIDVTNITGTVFWRVRTVDDLDAATPWSDTGKFELYRNAMERVARTRRLRVGISSSYVGEFAKLEDNQLTGLDIELARTIAARLGGNQLPKSTVEPEFIGFQWTSLLETPRQGKVDCIISTITIKKDREIQYALKFSQPYYQTYQVAAYLNGSRITNVADIARHRIGVQDGTTADDVARAFVPSQEIARYPSTTVLFQELLSGKIGVAITDQDFANREIRSLGAGDSISLMQFTKDLFPESFSGATEELYGIAVAQGQVELLTQIEATIDALKRDGTLKRLEEKFVKATPSASF